MRRSLITLSIIAAIMLSGSTLAIAQTVSDFENFALPLDSVYNGDDYAGGFNSGNAYFPNTYLYDSTYGGYWSMGFAYSSMRDSSDGSYLNMYSARPAIGAENSNTYAIGQQGSLLTLTGAGAGKAVMGMYITNGTYPANTLKYGDGFCKAFGGSTGNDPDWFKVTIKAWYNGVLGNDSVDFYLADYRFSNNTQDYIVYDWQWVNLLPLGNVDSLVFSLSSTDNGLYGMNTPPFFFFDNFTTADSPASIKEENVQSLQCYPNPASDELLINMPTTTGSINIRLADMSGRVLLSNTIIARDVYSLDLRNFEEGAYLLQLNTPEGSYRQTIIKATH